MSSSIILTILWTVLIIKNNIQCTLPVTANRGCKSLTYTLHRPDIYPLRIPVPCRVAYTYVPTYIATRKPDTSLGESLGSLLVFTHLTVAWQMSELVGLAGTSISHCWILLQLHLTIWVHFLCCITGPSGGSCCTVGRDLGCSYTSALGKRCSPSWFFSDCNRWTCWVCT